MWIWDFLNYHFVSSLKHYCWCYVLFYPIFNYMHIYVSVSQGWCNNSVESVTKSKWLFSSVWMVLIGLHQTFHRLCLLPWSKTDLSVNQSDRLQLPKLRWSKHGVEVEMKEEFRKDKKDSTIIPLLGVIGYSLQSLARAKPCKHLTDSHLSLSLPQTSTSWMSGYQPQKAWHTAPSWPCRLWAGHRQRWPPAGWPGELWLGREDDWWLPRHLTGQTNIKPEVTANYLYEGFL